MPEYNSWRAMIERCENPNHIGFKYYGGRGIKICARWRSSFEAFFADMGPKPSPRHTLDRKDNERGYEPDNCRWATPAEQRANQRPYDESVRVRAAWENRYRGSPFKIELTGQRFGRLVVLHQARVGIDGRARWVCLCVCGRETTVDGKSLRSGNTRSCGCLSRDKASERAVLRNRK